MKACGWVVLPLVALVFGTVEAAPGPAAQQSLWVRARRDDPQSWSCRVWFDMKTESACCQVCDDCPEYTRCDEAMSRRDAAKLLNIHKKDAERDVDVTERELDVDRERRGQCRVITYEGTHKCCQKRYGCRCPGRIVATCWSGEDDDDW